MRNRTYDLRISRSFLNESYVYDAFKIADRSCAQNLAYHRASVAQL